MHNWYFIFDLFLIKYLFLPCRECRERLVKNTVSKARVAYFRKESSRRYLFLLRFRLAACCCCRLSITVAFGVLVLLRVLVRAGRGGGRLLLGLLKARWSMSFRFVTSVAFLTFAPFFIFRFSAKIAPLRRKPFAVLAFACSFSFLSFNDLNERKID